MVKVEINSVLNADGIALGITQNVEVNGVDKGLRPFNCSAGLSIQFEKSKACPSEPFTVALYADGNQQGDAYPVTDYVINGVEITSVEMLFEELAKIECFQDGDTAMLDLLQEIADNTGTSNDNEELILTELTAFHTDYVAKQDLFQDAFNVYVENTEADNDEIILNLQNSLVELQEVNTNLLAFQAENNTNLLALNTTNTQGFADVITAITDSATDLQPVLDKLDDQIANDTAIKDELKGEIRDISIAVGTQTVALVTELQTIDATLKATVSKDYEQIQGVIGLDANGAPIVPPVFQYNEKTYDYQGNLISATPVLSQHNTDGTITSYTLGTGETIGTVNGNSASEALLQTLIDATNTQTTTLDSGLTDVETAIDNATDEDAILALEDIKQYLLDIKAVNEAFAAANNTDLTLISNDIQSLETTTNNGLTEIKNLQTAGNITLTSQLAEIQANGDTLSDINAGIIELIKKPIKDSQTICISQAWGQHLENDFTDSLQNYSAQSLVYSEEDYGVIVKSSGGSSTFFSKEYFPIQEDIEYTFRIKVTQKIKTGNGELRIGVASYDSNKAIINTDTANSYNYGLAFQEILNQGDYREYVAKFKGYNATSEGDKNKFDPYALYGRLALVTNIGGVADEELVIHSIERIPTEGTYEKTNGLEITQSDKNGVLIDSATIYKGENGEVIDTPEYFTYGPCTDCCGADDVKTEAVNEDIQAVEVTYTDLNAYAFTVYDGTADVTIDGVTTTYPKVGSNGTILGAEWCGDSTQDVTITAITGKVEFNGNKVI